MCFHYHNEAVVRGTFLLKDKNTVRGVGKKAPSALFSLEVFNAQKAW